MSGNVGGPAYGQACQRLAAQIVALGDRLGVHEIDVAVATFVIGLERLKDARRRFPECDANLLPALAQARELGDEIAAKLLDAGGKV